MIKEIKGRFTCTDCGYVYSSMLGDDEIPETCNKGKQRGVEIHENGRLVAVGGMKDFIIDNDMEGTDEAKAILSLEQGASTNVSTGQGWVQIRRNDDV